MLLAATLGLLGLLGACDPEDRQAPTTAEFVIEKAPEVSGDKQVGVAGEPLPEDLRARVTRDGKPAAGVTVYWTTMQGAMDPPEAVTDAEGISASRWTTQNTYLEEEAFASLDPVTAPRVPGSVLPGMIMYTALAYPDPDAPTTVLVMNDNRFEPASIVVPVGGIVNWFWPAGSAGHNIVPDDGNAPATSGAPAGYPKYLSFTFANPGVYRYHCAVHGAPGGVGMSGSVTVLAPDQPR
jgi:plastocyanin